MAWNGSGTFTRTNGVNTGTTVWADDAAAAVKIVTGRHDTHDQDLATGIQACVTKNGETKVTADFSPNVTDTYDLGTTVLKWEDLHLNGNALIGGTLGVTGAVVLTSTLSCTTLTANNIQFPATQVPSADANNLDDYEEGTWTPALSFGGGTTGLTYLLQAGTYTKIGRLVTAHFNLQVNAKGSSTGTALLTGLPFTVANVNSMAGSGGGMSYWSGMGASLVYLGIAGNLNATTASIVGATAAAAGLSDLTHTALADSAIIRGTITYHV